MICELSLLKETLRYDPLTGELTWLVGGGRRSVGQSAGYKRGDGYIGICVNRRQTKAHIVAWALTHGAWPTEVIDHKNGDKSDNRLANLREATKSQNAMNSARHSRNRSGFKGVSPSRNGKRWMGFIRVCGKNHNLGTFDTPEQAHAAYLTAATANFGEFKHGG